MWPVLGVAARSRPSGALAGWAAGMFTAVTGGTPLMAAELAFSRPVNVSRSATISQSAALAVDRTGVITIAWEEFGRRLLLSRSNARGTRFSEPHDVVPPHPDFSPGQIHLAASHDLAVHVTWTDFDVVFGGAEIAYSRSADGATFSPLRLLSTLDGINSVVSRMAADGARLSVAWQDTDLNRGGSSIAFRRSGDLGLTFHPRQARVLASGSELHCPVVSAHGEEVSVIWYQHPTDLMWSRSTDRGVRFSAPTSIVQTTKRMWCPRIATETGGRTHLVWEDGFAFDDRRVMVSRRDTGSATFTPPLPLSPTTADAFCPAVAADGHGRAYVTWSTGDFFEETLETFLAVSTDGGATFAPPVKLPFIGSDAGCPELAATGTRLHFVWHEPPTPGSLSDIFYSRVTVTSP
jgi:hypothetical protein